MTPKLVVVGGPNRGTEVPLTGRIIFNIGSDRGSTVFLDDNRVAPNHCRLYNEESKFTLFDVSGKGMQVNGKRVVKAVLNDGDTIALGSSQLRFFVRDTGSVGVAPSGGAPAYLPPSGPGVPVASAGAPSYAPPQHGGGAAGAPPQGAPPAPSPYGQPGPGPGAAGASSGRDDFRMNLSGPGGSKFTRVWLQCVEGNDKGKIFDLSEGTCWVIGRGHSADITVMDIKVSRAHTRIDRVGDTFYVNDLNSTNGSFVNGQQIERQELHRGDYVKTGYTILCFQYETVEEAQAAGRAPARPLDAAAVAGLRDDPFSAQLQIGGQSGRMGMVGAPGGPMAPQAQPPQFAPMPPPQPSPMGAPVLAGAPGPTSGMAIAMPPGAASMHGPGAGAPPFASPPGAGVGGGGFGMPPGSPMPGGGGYGPGGPGMGPGAPVGAGSAMMGQPGGGPPYGQPSPFGQQAPQAPPTYGQQALPYGQPAPPYGQPAPPYGQPSPFAPAGFGGPGFPGGAGPGAPAAPAPGAGSQFLRGPGAPPMPPGGGPGGGQSGMVAGFAPGSPPGAAGPGRPGAPGAKAGFDDMELNFDALEDGGSDPFAQGGQPPPPAAAAGPGPGAPPPGFSAPPVGATTGANARRGRLQTADMVVPDMEMGLFDDPGLGSGSQSRPGGSGAPGSAGPPPYGGAAPGGPAYGAPPGAPLRCFLCGEAYPPEATAQGRLVMVQGNPYCQRCLQR